MAASRGEEPFWWKWRVVKRDVFAPIAGSCKLSSQTGKLEFLYIYRCIHTVSDLVLGHFTLFLNVESAEVHVPFALPARRCSDAYFGRGWRRETFDAGDADEILAYLLHVHVCNVGCNVAVVIQRALDFVEQL